MKSQCQSCLNDGSQCRQCIIRLPYGYPTPTAPVITQQSTSVVSHGPVSASVNASALTGEKGHTLGKMVPIRVINPDKRSEYTTYNLRNLTAGSFSSVSGLKN